MNQSETEANQPQNNPDQKYAQRERQDANDQTGDRQARWFR